MSEAASTGCTAAQDTHPSPPGAGHGRSGRKIVGLMTWCFLPRCPRKCRSHWPFCAVLQATEPSASCGWTERLRMRVTCRSKSCIGTFHSGSGSDVLSRAVRPRRRREGSPPDAEKRPADIGRHRQVAKENKGGRPSPEGLPGSGDSKAECLAPAHDARLKSVCHCGGGTTRGACIIIGLGELRRRKGS